MFLLWNLYDFYKKKILILKSVVYENSYKKNICKSNRFTLCVFNGM